MKSAYRVDPSTKMQLNASKSGKVGERMDFDSKKQRTI